MAMTSDIARSKALLATLTHTNDIHSLAKSQLPAVSREIRQFLIDTVSEIGGHFGSNLGVVELTVALHYVYNPEKDRIVWDVGHQAYAHKVLSGRKGALSTIRKKGGLAPFPKRHESVADAFGVGHASTSISAATGFALAHAGECDAPHVIAVIGDGALTGGMAFEALNHAGGTGADVLVILNDNKMSISPNVGAITQYLTRLLSSREYTHVREKGKHVLRGAPALTEIARRVKKQAKGMILPGTIFEEMGFHYFGPVDGHDVEALVDVLENLKRITGPRLLHVVTCKGKGCTHAERDPLALHAVSSFDPVTGKKKGGTEARTFTHVFSSWVTARGSSDERLHVVTPAMREGSGLVEFSAQFPDRFHDVGIAEQHAVTLAAGFACAGKKPVVAIYSSFLQRAYDQVVHDVAIQNLDVLFAIDRAGIVGPDGETHAGSFDLTFLRCIPNLVIMAPATAEECAAMLDVAYAHPGPACVRYPRAAALSAPENAVPVEIGKGVVERRGKTVAILSFGALLERCRAAAEALDATLVNMRSVKPLDGALVTEMARTHTHIVTVEDNSVLGGAGSAVNEYCAQHDLSVRIRNLGLPDTFLPHGTRDEILADAGLDATSLQTAIETWLAKK